MRGPGFHPGYSGTVEKNRYSRSTAACASASSYAQHLGGRVVKPRYTVVLSMLAGAALGATAIHGLHAQAKPPVYYIAEIDVTNPEAYVKEYAPLAQASIKAA